MEIGVLKGQLAAAIGNLWGAKLGALVAAIATAVTKYVADCPEAVQNAAFAALLFFIVDAILGVTRAVVDRTVSSKGFGQGVVKLIVYLAALGMAVGIDTLMIWYHVAPLFILYWIAAREGISAVENASALGFPLPGWLTRILEQYQETGNEGPDES